VRIQGIHGRHVESAILKKKFRLWVAGCGLAKMGEDRMSIQTFSYAKDQQV